MLRVPSKIADIFKIKAVILLPKPLYTYTALNLSPQLNISHFVWLKLRKCFAFDSVSCLGLFKIAIYNCI